MPMPVFLFPVDPSFRALHGRLTFTARRHTFNKDSLDCVCQDWDDKEVKVDWQMPPLGMAQAVTAPPAFRTKTALPTETKLEGGTSQRKVEPPLTK